MRATGRDDGRAPALPETLAAWTGRRVLVVGDVMLDRFVYGEVSRISPEAPVPVLRYSREVKVLGGAGNVARNIVAMGGRPILIGVCGRDQAAADIARLAQEDGIEHHLIASDGPTTQKTRFVAQGQQLLRLDDEEVATRETVGREVVELARAALAEAEAIILSDYAKGVLTDDVLSAVIAAARLRGVPVAVDPKRADMSVYRGATLLTPNAAETRLATGIDPASHEAAEAAGYRLRETTSAPVIMITRGARGVTLVTDEGCHHLHSSAREVFDVSGAGDTLMAAAALSLAAGRSALEGARIANAAAGVVVGRAGTATVDRTAIAEALEQSPRSNRPKIADTVEAAGLAEAWRQQGLTVGFTNGCFDLLHLGHVKLLTQAKAACDRLIVGLNSDDSVRRLKGSDRPINPLADRAGVLAALNAVDLVVPFEEDTPLALVTALTPDLLVKGADYAGKTVVGRQIVEARGGRVLLVELVPDRSTTTIESKLKPALSGA